MSTGPPPPPMPIATTASSLKRKSVDQNNNSKLDLRECLWAVGDSEVQRACFFARTCSHSSPKECVYSIFTPLMQTGPTCGLCALSMLFGGVPATADLLTTAIKRNYTNKGEMFSAQWLLEVLNENIKFSSLQPDKTRAYIYDGVLDSEFIKKKLKRHCVLLVPYDADKNHSPCNENGRKAHWTLICGYLVEDERDFHVFALHGKTKNLGLFSLKSLSDSNENLKEFTQPAWNPDEVFLQPKGGICGPMGLKNKSIVIEGLQNEVVKVV